MANEPMDEATATMLNAAVEANAAGAVKSGDATDEQKDKAVYEICPCCGKPTLLRPVEIKGELLDHYLSCMISGVPFTHTYPIYKGKLEVTITVLPNEKMYSMRSGLTAVDALHSKLPDNEVLNKNIKTLLQLYCCVSAVNINMPGVAKLLQPEETAQDICKQLKTLQLSFAAGSVSKEDVEKELDKYYATLTSASVVSAVPIAVLGALIETHNKLYDILIDAGFDTNFWKGIELA